MVVVGALTFALGVADENVTAARAAQTMFSSATTRSAIRAHVANSLAQRSPLSRLVEATKRVGRLFILLLDFLIQQARRSPPIWTYKWRGTVVAALAR